MFQLKRYAMAASLMALMAGPAIAADTAAKAPAKPASVHKASGTKVTAFMAQNGAANILVLAQGKGPTIVLLPSLGRGQDDFDLMAADLAKSGFRVLRPQPRGIDGSTGPMTGITLHDFAGDVAAAILADNGGQPKKAILAGHAFGGFVARMLAADRPDLTRGIVLMAAGAGVAPSPPKARQAIKDSANDKLPDAKRLEALQYVFFAPGNDPHIWLKNWHAQVLDQQRVADDATPMSAYFAGGGVAPILDVQPTQDTIVPVSDSDIIKTKLAPRVMVVIVPHAGHAMIIEQPGLTTKAVVAWARKLPKD